LYEYNLGAYGPGVSAPWMQHFFMQSLGLGSDIDPLSSMTAYNAVRHWMYRGAVDILGDSSGFCFNYASDYNIAISATDGMNPLHQPNTSHGPMYIQLLMQVPLQHVLIRSRERLLAF